MYRRLFAVCLFLANKTVEDERNSYKSGVRSSLVHYTRRARNPKKTRRFIISVFFNFNLVIAIAVFYDENLRYTCMNLFRRRIQ